MHIVMEQILVLRSDAPHGRLVVIRADHGGNLRILLEASGQRVKQVRRNHDIGVDEQYNVGAHMAHSLISDTSRTTTVGKANDAYADPCSDLAGSIRIAIRDDDQLVWWGTEGLDSFQAPLKRSSSVVHRNDKRDRRPSPCSASAVPHTGLRLPFGVPLPTTILFFVLNFVL